MPSSIPIPIPRERTKDAASQPSERWIDVESRLIVEPLSVNILLILIGEASLILRRKSTLLRSLMSP